MITCRNSISTFALLLLLKLQLTAQVPANYSANYAKAPRFKALIYFSDRKEGAHVIFAHQTIDYLQKLTVGDGFLLDTTQNFGNYSYEKLKDYQIVIMPDGYPTKKEERAVFEQYMEKGGGWMGFHESGYNDKDTHWPWFVNFLGGGVFYCNNWPPQPAKIKVDQPNHPITKNLPLTWTAPASEWYQWNPSPRLNKNIDILLSLSADNYPLGIKDVINFGDFPVVWTNRQYRMIYLNMGHGDEIYSDATQKLLIINALKWVLSNDKQGNPFTK
ncbi:ThuA domain-containing protein [Spirosoma sp.]|uniref:ThuA domain-containing protein n=1 Tax=Spirosoma sp. TaxID=1899569 RepID=UPI0026365D00|nr:ThuA domain-containing protein [Spirosoma sp.]MCX6216310.1 ThuA domain-containing protein [Spirosoma sp.]